MEKDDVTEGAGGGAFFEWESSRKDGDGCGIEQAAAGVFRSDVGDGVEEEEEVREHEKDDEDDVDQTVYDPTPGITQVLADYAAEETEAQFMRLRDEVLAMKRKPERPVDEDVADPLLPPRVFVRGYLS